MAPASSKLYNYMLQQDDLVVKILCLYRQIKKKKKANNMNPCEDGGYIQIFSIGKSKVHITG